VPVSVPEATSAALASHLRDCQSDSPSVRCLSPTPRAGSGGPGAQQDGHVGGAGGREGARVLPCPAGNGGTDPPHAPEVGSLLVSGGNGLATIYLGLGHLGACVGGTRSRVRPDCRRPRATWECRPSRDKERRICQDQRNRQRAVVSSRTRFDTKHRGGQVPPTMTGPPFSRSGPKRSLLTVKRDVPPPAPCARPARACGLAPIGRPRFGRAAAASPTINHHRRAHLFVPPWRSRPSLNCHGGL
jgi:hypothetical protein